MQTNPATTPSKRANGSDASHEAAGTEPAADLFMRNYDPYETYELTLRILDVEGEPAFRGRYRFQPGQVEHVSGVLDPGRYEVSVELARRYEDTVTCRVDAAPARTINIEVGNGIVSVTEGLYG